MPRNSVRPLRDDADARAKFRAVASPDVDAVEKHLAGGRVVEAGYERYERGFSRTGVADDADRLSREGLERDFRKNGLF